MEEDMEVEYFRVDCEGVILGKDRFEDVKDKFRQL